MEKVFHAVCAVVLLLSIAAFLHGDRRERLTDDPRGDLLSYLSRQGATIGEARALPNGEAVIAVSFPGCTESGKLVYLPVIHRITDIARREWESAAHPIFVHDRGVVASLAPWRIVPRWLVRRLEVNVQLSPEDPWISIAFVLVPPDGCRWPAMDWRRLSEPV